MNIGFFGTPEIASYCLKRLSLEHKIKFVVTTPDKTSGRNRKVNFSPVKIMAQKLEIDILQPANLKDPVFFDIILKYNIDIFVVVAYGKIIPKSIYDIPNLKTINLHPSLLPLYRGAAPIEWSIVDGNIETGITVQLINERMDAGDIIMQKSIPLNKNINSRELHEIILPIGSDMLLESIKLLESGKYDLIVQDEARATYCTKIDIESSHIDWNKSATDIHNMVRGFNPKPVAWSELRGIRMKIWKTEIFEDELNVDLPIGGIYKLTKKRIVVTTGNGFLEILSIQPEGKKQIDAISFLNGYRIKESERFI